MTPGFEIMLPIFITTLGPLKVIPVFYALTRNAPCATAPSWRCGRR